MSLMIHCGGQKVDLDAVQAVRTPVPTRTHYPIPHDKLLDLTVQNLIRSGFEVEGAEYALRDGKDENGNLIPGAQFFGLLQLRNGRENPDYSLIAGVRNAHDKGYSASLALGSRVFVCDNLSFSGEVRFGRKHTRYINRDLPYLVRDTMGRLGVLRESQEKRIESYKDKGIGDNFARCLIMRAAEEDCLSWSKCGKVWAEWKRPRHDAFQPRNAWSLFNGFTEILKDYNIQDLPKRTQGIHEIFDTACGVLN